MRHTQTDPACVKHQEPRTRFGWWLFNRARGRACVACVSNADARFRAAAKRQSERWRATLDLLADK